MKLKDNTYTEDYVKYCPFRKKRSLLAQFPLGILHLYAETDRFRNTKLDERLHLLCNTDDSGDEQQFTSVIYHHLEK